MTEQQRIQELSGQQQHSCSCNACKSMCKNVPCAGTPQDILNLVNAGFADKLAPTILSTIATNGYLPDVYMVQPEFDKKRGCCMFFTDDGLCSLHDLGLKPTEGKLATHLPQKPDMVNTFPMPWLVAATWVLPQNVKTIKLIVKALGKINFAKPVNNIPQNSQKIFQL